MNKISVIVPTYNCSTYIEEAVISILNQTLPPSEIIIVDDGSTDNTEEVIRKLNIPNIIYIKQTNSGVSKARNAGIQRASGDYVAFLDADDRWLPNMLAEQYKVLDEYPEVVFCFTNFIRFNESTKERLPDQFQFYPEINSLDVIPSKFDGVSIIKNDGFCTLIGFGEFPGFTQAILFRVKAIFEMRFNEKLKVCEDAEFILQVSTMGRVAYNTKVLLEVRRHESNATRDISLIALYKLDAIKLLSLNKNLTPSQRTALDKRTVRAYIDAAISIKKQGELQKAIKFYHPVFNIHGNEITKLKGLLKLLLPLRRSFEPQ